MKFSKFILTLATLLTTGSAVAAGFDAQNEPLFTPGSTGNVLIKADLPQGTAALQFTVTLPEEFMFNTTALVLNQDANLQSNSNEVSDNTYKYVIYSNDNTDISSVNDYLFGFSLTAKTTTEGGSYPLKFTNVIAATASGAETHIADCEVAVPVIIPVSQVVVNPTSASIVIGESVKLTANALPANANQSVTWEVNNPDVVSVDENGLARGLSVGNARVTARSTENTNYSAFCDITVNPITATAISLDKTALELRVGASATLHATVSPDNATNAAVSWSSSDRSVVVVDENGTLTPLKAGKATVTATTADGTNLSASCSVTVLPPLATGVTLSNTSVSLTVKESMTLKATVSPAEADQKVEWSTSDAKIVTVDAKGTITAQSAGSAVVTATATDGSGVAASCQVTVTDAKVTSITLSKTALGMRIGETETISATVLPEYAAKREVTWTSDKPAVATVDANGKVTAVALGEATITVAATDGSGVTAT
ncbi:MAG: Ig-like domain-containing protein, partial [Muribaculaceae bacterium]|nr:Ig-like domain-containing protein [Muribaculaceae bacterium]